MKKGVKIFLLIVAFILAAGAAFCVWQWENLRAVYMYLTIDKEEMALPSSDILQIPGLPATDVEDNEESDENEVAGSGQKSTKSSTGTHASSGKKNDGTAAGDTSSLVAKCRAELYACESSLISRVSGMRDEVLSQWRALSPEQRTSRKKREMIVSGIGRCLSLEGEVDGKVKAIIAKYKAMASDAGESTAEITALWDEYTEKKASTKAYYLNKYLG